MIREIGEKGKKCRIKGDTGKENRRKTKEKRKEKPNESNGAKERGEWKEHKNKRNKTHFLFLRQKNSYLNARLLELRPLIQ